MHTYICLPESYVSSCSDSVASPSQWLLNPDCSIRAPKASGPHPGMSCQNSGENPGENCGEHLNLLVALFLSGKHLGGRSKPTPTENHWTQLFEGVRADINFTLFDCHTSRLNRLLRVQLSLSRGRNVGWTGGRSKCPICWSSLTSSGNHVETQTTNGKQTLSESNVGLELPHCDAEVATRLAWWAFLMTS